ncbi:MAG: 50S ribosomal protein L9 [Patescibacteria group bacterium]|nr:50S ribosomal protein L9 [Patescibacteria group bacterium]
MKIILKEDIKKLGQKGEVKAVSPGYARNFLIAKNLAEKATPNKIKTAKKKAKKREKRKLRQEKENEKILETFKSKEITLKMKSNEEGHLFAAVHKSDILKKIKKNFNLDLKEKNIILDKPIKQTGQSNIKIKLADQEAKLKLTIK